MGWGEGRHHGIINCTPPSEGKAAREPMDQLCMRRARSQLLRAFASEHSAPLEPICMRLFTFLTGQQLLFPQGLHLSLCQCFPW